MKLPVLVVLFGSVSLFVCNTVEGADDRRLQLKIIKHQPCSKPGNANEKIRFPNNDQAPLVEDESKGDGCYTIKGTVQVLKQITGQVQLYTETKYGTKAPVEECKGADENGCGGAGSCVYCNVCKGIKDLGKSAVQLMVGNESFDCKKGLAPKNYTDIRISFCMPTKADFLKSQNIDEDFWNRYGASGQMVFLTLYIFNEPVNKMSHSELTSIASPDNAQVIGCHKLVGSVFEANN
jgi:hypothetical protein